MGRLSYLRSFRIVASPALVPHVEALLQAEDYEFEPEPFSTFCRRLLYEPKPLGSSLAAFFGYIYIQDRSSMLSPLALSPLEGTAVLDMCASPGGKSGFLAQLAGSNGFVLANESNPARLATLRANLRQLNLLNVGTSAYGGETIPLQDGSWTSILLDPPCSGWGTEEKNPSVRKIWKGDKIRNLMTIQRKLLARASALLAPGGRLLYSTCTTNPEENSSQRKYAVEVLGLTHVPLKPFPGFVFEENALADGDLLVMGEDSQAQGFYITLLTKDSCACQSRMSRAQDHDQHGAIPGLPLDRNSVDSALLNLDLLPAGNPYLFGDKVRFIPALSAQLPQNFKWQAFLLGQLSRGKTQDLIPDHSLHSFLNSTSPACINLDGIQEIRNLLSGQSITTHLKAPLASLWWRELPLGIVSIKSGRIIPAFH